MTDRQPIAPDDPEMPDVQPPADPIAPRDSGPFPHPEGPVPGTGLVAMRAEPGRATLAAVLVVVLTDASVLAAGALLRLIGAIPDPVRGTVWFLVVASGYLAGLGVAVALTRTKGGSFADDYGFRGLTSAEFGWALLAAVAVRIVGGLWAALILGLKLNLPGMDLDPTSVLPSDPLSIVWAFVLFAGIAPFVEEVGFRAVMFGSLERRMNPWGANLITAGLFAGLHFNMFGFVPIFVSSIAFAWLFRRTRSLWTAVFAHAVFNGLGLVVAYLLQGRMGL